MATTWSSIAIAIGAERIEMALTRNSEGRLSLTAAAESVSRTRKYPFQEHCLPAINLHILKVRGQGLIASLNGIPETALPPASWLQIGLARNPANGFPESRAAPIAECSYRNDAKRAAASFLPRVRKVAMADRCLAWGRALPSSQL